MTRGRFWFGKTVDLVSSTVVLLALIVGSMNLMDWEAGPMRRLVHLSAYFAFGLVIVAAWQWRRVRHWQAVVSLVLGLSFAAQPALLWLPQASKSPEVITDWRLTVMGYNVYRNNRKFDETLKRIQEADADVVFLTEVAPEWHEALAPLRRKYRESLGQDEDLLFSRYPLRDARRVTITFDAAKKANEAGAGSLASLPEELRRHWWSPNLLTAEVQTPHGNVRLVCMHPPTPATDLSIAIQRAEALIAAEELKADDDVAAKVLMGDLNTSPFSPTFRFILRETGLRDSARGFGYHPTWGPRLPREPCLPWIGLPIDHLLASDSVHIIGREIGPPTGSDHRWLLVRLAW